MNNNYFFGITQNLQYFFEVIAIKFLQQIFITYNFLDYFILVYYFRKVTHFIHNLVCLQILQRKQFLEYFFKFIIFFLFIIYFLYFLYIIKINAYYFLYVIFYFIQQLYIYLKYQKFTQNSNFFFYIYFAFARQFFFCQIQAKVCFLESIIKQIFYKFQCLIFTFFVKRKEEAQMKFICFSIFLQLQI
ncbi:hypothetical protein IMG5_112280 [Ichthyophthirius multifiliis]|uniref:Transmembrane protein n=1 Tax=Ichthyophthirius multifiliis TaxID=5932 RepID=G0QTW1_ICHMU|nr:hypothetical protein IMG5_112280 [Ichthyophthirius multifiliis]EGR31344.1 hypothetical protein IMG5_112280 [Ichthyophthirius multifiliis]|eukprot:XP_004034830.1 hypothetical protein IMG5_112280 [Ichthyophthirius multifiliis]